MQQWTDPRLNHSLQFPITLASSDSKNLIWLPDTYFLNIRSAAIHDVTSENTKVKIRRGGFVTYSIRLVSAENKTRVIVQFTTPNLSPRVFSAIRMHIWSLVAMFKASNMLGKSLHEARSRISRSMQLLHSQQYSHTKSMSRHFHRLIYFLIRVPFLL